MEKQEFLNQLRSFLKAASTSHRYSNRLFPANAAKGDTVIEVEFYVQEHSFISADFDEPVSAGTYVSVLVGEAFRVLDDTPLRVSHRSVVYGHYRCMPECYDVNTAKSIILGELDEPDSDFLVNVLNVLDEYNRFVESQKGYEFDELSAEAKQTAYQNFNSECLWEGAYLFDKEVTASVDFATFERYFADAYIYEKDGGIIEKR